MATFPFRSVSVATVVSILAGIIYRLTPNSYYPQPLQTAFEPEISKISQKIIPVETIFDFLQEDNKSLLKKEGSSAKWNSNWTSLQKKYNNIENVPEHWQFQGLRQALTGNIAISKFKEQCQINSRRVKGRGDPLYTEVKEYCTEDMNKENA